MLSLPVCFAEELNLIYDANGNLITGDGKYREYNSLNQLYRVYNGSDSSADLLQEYVYDPVEERILIKKTFNPDLSVKEKVIYVSQNFIQVHNDSGIYNITYVYHEGQLIAQEINGVKQFIHSDHLGSSTVVTDANGTVLENTSYSPYGEILEGGSVSRLDYEGKEFDSVVGDYDFHFRKFNPSWGVFTQPDTLIQNVYDPQSLNHYMFERGNPYKYQDKDGHAFLLDDGAILSAIAIAVISGVAIYLVANLVVWTIDSIPPKIWNDLESSFKSSLKAQSLSSDLKKGYDISNNIIKGEIRGAAKEATSLIIDKAFGNYLTSKFIDTKYEDLYGSTGSIGTLVGETVFGKGKTYVTVKHSHICTISVPKDGYFINGKEVTESEYFTKLNKAREKAKN